MMLFQDWSDKFCYSNFFYPGHLGHLRVVENAFVLLVDASFSDIKLFVQLHGG